MRKNLGKRAIAIAMAATMLVGGSLIANAETAKVDGADELARYVLPSFTSGHGCTSARIYCWVKSPNAQNTEAQLDVTYIEFGTGNSQKKKTINLADSTEDSLSSITWSADSNQIIQEGDCYYRLYVDNTLVEQGDL